LNHARRIGPFTLAEVLAEGPGTVLYRATRAEGARPPYEVIMRVAVDPMDAVTAASVRHEFDVLRTMDNPRIPKVYGHYESDAAVAISHHDGVSLAHILSAQKAGTLTLGTGAAIDIAIEIAHAVRHANGLIGANGVRLCHGHLQPELVRLTSSGDIIVMGFGSIPARVPAAYTAPEVIAGEAPSPQSDQWSIGAMLIEMILGEALYTGVANARLSAAEGDMGHWLLAACHAHPELETPLQTMMSKVPSDRFERGHELLKALLASGRLIGGTVNRRSLMARAMAHEPPALPPPPVAAEPTVTWDPPLPEQPMPSIGSTADLDGSPEPISMVEQAPALPKPDGFAFAHIDGNAPPAPEPVPRLLPSEFAGIALGTLMMLLGLTYVFWVL
jgi:serine/threonine protein kinase